MIKKKSKKAKQHDEIVLLAKYNLNTIEALISKNLIDSYIRQDEFVPLNMVLKIQDGIKEAKRTPKIFNSGDKYA